MRDAGIKCTEVPGGERKWRRCYDCFPCETGHTSNARYPPNRGVQRGGLLCPLYVDSSRPVSANTGHCPRVRRMGQIDPLLTYKTGPVNGREGRGSGLPEGVGVGFT